jgi:hypothetical protein
MANYLGVDQPDPQTRDFVRRRRHNLQNTGLATAKRDVRHA